METDGKQCPLFRAARGSSAPLNSVLCIKETCAWFLDSEQFEEGGVCAILRLANPTPKRKAKSTVSAL
jgi:hypothetical protein